MNITIISNNYYPEDSGIGLYSSNMADFLAVDNNVTVVTGFPYYPQWEIHEKYKNRGTYYKETVNNVEILRFKQYTPSVQNFSRRILQMIHFFFGSIINIFKIKKNDVVIVVVPFTISILLGLLLKLIRGGKLTVHIQDFEFDAAFETGISAKGGLLSKIIFRTERFLLNRADFVSTISNGMMNKLKTKTKANTYYFPNWIDYKKIDPTIAKTTVFFDNNKYNILYSGNIGAKQDWDFFLDFAHEMKSISKVQITLIGAGAKSGEVIEKVKDLENVSYFPPVKYEDLNDVLCGANLHILFQKTTVIDTVMPSKILGMMASEIPSIVTGHENSEVKHNFAISNGGFYFYEEDKMFKIKNQIISLIEDDQLSKSIGKNARKFVIENFSIEKILADYQYKLSSLK